MVPSSGKSSSFTSWSINEIWPSVDSTSSKPGLISSSGSRMVKLMAFTLLLVSWFPMALMPFTAMNSSILMVSGSFSLPFSLAKISSAVALLAVITSYRISHTEDVPVDEQEHFVPAMPETSPVLTEMDPRNTEFHESPEVEEMQEELRQAG